MTKKAVCLVSGGIDSSVTAFIAKSKDYDIYALSFNYGQKHKKEIDCAKKIVSSVDAKKHVVFDIDLGLFGGSSLVDKSLEPEKDHELGEIGKTIPSTYVPARNTVFLSIALAYAEVVDADAIFIGVTATDYSGYPDCRPEYVEAFSKMASLATKKGIEGNSIEIYAPLMSLSKAEIIKKGLDLGVPFANTWSCYRGGDKACGTCDSCLLRLKGFQESSNKDPLVYKSLPDWYK